MKSGKTIGIIMTYNCSHLLEDTYFRIPRESFDEIIIVDDGSADQTETERIAKQLNIPFFGHEHTGYGGNLRYGLRQALERGAEYMVEIHGDGQFDLSVIPIALQKIREGYDLVLGSRFTNLLQPLRDGMPFIKYFANIGLSFIQRLILRISLSEFQNGLRVCNRNLIKKLPVEGTSNDYLYGFEIIAQAVYFKLKITEIPIGADYQKEHTSISIWKSTIYVFQTLNTLFLFVLARLGFKTSLFQEETH